MKLKNILFASLLGLGLVFIVSCDKDDDMDDPVLTDCEKTTYDAEVKVIINKACNVSGCHDGADGSERVALTNFSQSHGAGGGIMNRAVTNKDMPPAGAISAGKVDALTDAEIATLKCWLDNGKKEN